MSDWNFTIAETGIVERIKLATQTGPDSWARKVGTRKFMTSITEDMQVVPAVYVLYRGFSILSASEYEATLAHRWGIVLAIGNATPGAEASPLNQEAGPLLGNLFALLHGFTAPACTTPLVPQTPPEPWFGESKFAYYPLLFTNQSYHCTNF